MPRVCPLLPTPQFLWEHLRHEDVRLYLKDLLLEYGALMRYKPNPVREAICYTGMHRDRVLSFPALGTQAGPPWLTR